MTAIFMWRAEDAIVTAADGLSYCEGGIVQGVGSKILLMPEHDTVITLQGPAALISLVRNRLGLQLDGFDDVIEDLPDALAGLCDEIEERTGEGSACNAYVGGWSRARQRMESYFVRSIASEAEGHYSVPGTPWSLTPAPPAIAAPWPSAEAFERFGFADMREDSIDPMALAGRVICAARYTPASAEHGNCEGSSLVGGFLEIAVLRQGWCSTEIAHRWPDPAGEAVDPARGDDMPEWLRSRPISPPLPSGGA